MFHVGWELNFHTLLGSVLPRLCLKVKNKGKKKKNHYSVNYGVLIFVVINFESS